MKFWRYIFSFLWLIIFLIFIAVLQIPDENFHLIACNVGQGDATLMIYKNIQVLIDGGPDNKVMNCLGKHLPFWDREIEMVILTHPDSDHFTGLNEIFKRYKVDNYLSNPVTTGKSDHRVLENIVGREGTGVLTPHQGQVLRVGLIQLDILAPLASQIGVGEPPGDIKIVTDESTNDFSVVSLVSFGKFRSFLTGDMPPKISDDLAQNWSGGPVNYIKMSHHGSKNGTTLNLLRALMPKVAVISVGKNNYGQPDGGVIQMLEKENIKTLRTDEKGDIEVITDGEDYKIDLQKN